MSSQPYQPPRNSFNRSTFIGFLITVGVLYFTAFDEVKNPLIYFNPDALLIVIGGTIAITLVAFPIQQLTQVFDFILFSVFRYRQTNYVTLVEELAEIHQAVIQNDHRITAKRFSHPFLSESVALLMKPTLTYKETAILLQDRVNVFQRRYSQDARILEAIAKYPTAFGFLGATAGIITAMTQAAASWSWASFMINLASSLVAVFWGIAITNFLLRPLADNAQKAFQADEFTRLFIRDGVLLIKSQTGRRFLIEKLSSMLPLSLRTEALGSVAAAQALNERVNVVEIFRNQKKKAQLNESQTVISKSAEFANPRFALKNSDLPHRPSPEAEPLSSGKSLEAQDESEVVEVSPDLQASQILGITEKPQPSSDAPPIEQNEDKDAFLDSQLEATNIRKLDEQELLNLNIPAAQEQKDEVKEMRSRRKNRHKPQPASLEELRRQYQKRSVR